MLAAAGKGVSGSDLLKEASETISLGERIGLLIARPELRVAAELLALKGTGHETV